MPQTLEYKDARNKNRIRHTADNGNVTYASTQGYENLTDMRQAAINAAIELLEHYINEARLNQEQLTRLSQLGMEAEEDLETNEKQT